MKTKKQIPNFRRLTSAAVLAAILLPLASCSSEEIVEETSNVTEDTTTVLTSTVETEARYLPEGVRYDGEKVHMFVRAGSSLPEFFVDEQKGEIVSDAIFDRNLKVQEDLGVTFSFREETSDWASRQQFADTISASIMAGDQAFDVVAGYSKSISSYLAANGMLGDMLSTKYLNFAQPWWSDSLIEQAKVNNKLYFATGDISTWALYCMFGVFYNRDMLKDYDLQNPADLVDNNQWTLDKMIEMSKGIYKDLNGNTTKDLDDQLGMAVPYPNIDSFYHASGLNTTELDEKGMPYVSDDLTSEKTVNLVELLCKIFHSDDTAYIVKDSETNSFVNGHVLFTISTLSYGRTLANGDFAYGIVPVPKYDAEQKSYATILSNPHTLYGIPKDARDYDMTSAVLESLAAEGYKLVSPALFEINMKKRYSEDDQTSRMYDIIKGSVCFDFGRVFTDQLGTLTYGPFRNKINSNTGDTWMSSWASSKPQLETMLADLLKTFQSFEE